MIAGINASRARSGGARAHLIGILSEVNPQAHGFDSIHVWSYPALLDALPDRPWLVRHAPQLLLKGLVHQLMWERFFFSRAVSVAGCNVVLNVDAGTIATAKPAVTMSRDMLSYEPGEMERYHGSVWQFRLLALRFLQNRSLRRAQGTIFLTRYAADVIQQSCGKLDNVAIIPHGVGEEFRRKGGLRTWPTRDERPIECLYISPVWRFKHQWHVVRAIAELRRRGHCIRLTLVGDGETDMIEKLRGVMAEVDPAGSFITYLGPVPHSELPAMVQHSDVFLMASSCENMPNTLLEGMAAGLPIASSDRGPMPEVIEDGAVMFDPESPSSIAAAIEKILNDADLRERIAARAAAIAGQYSWSRCARETFDFLASIATGAQRVSAG